MTQLQERIAKEGAVLFDYNSDIYQEMRGFELIGHIRGTSSREIAASPLSVGFETLDRDTFNPEDVYDILPASGVKRARLQTAWIKCERQPGVYDFSLLDSQVNNLLQRGIKPWFNVTFGNPLYTPVAAYEEIIRSFPPGQAPARIRGYCGETPIYFGEKGMRGWCNYLSALAKHFQGRVDEFEIWNEPFGIGEFWKQDGGMPYPELPQVERFRRCVADYAEMVRQSSVALKDADPQIKVIANVSVDNRFADELIANGIANWVDILSYHLYPTSERETLQKVQHLRYALDAAGGSHIPLWQGESGFPSDHAENLCVTSEYVQAKYIGRRILKDVQCGAQISSIFTVTDFQRYYADGSTQHFGIIDGAKKAPKLGFNVLESLAKLVTDLKYAPELLATFTSPNGNANFDTTEFQCHLFAMRSHGIPVIACWREGKVDISHSPIVGELTLFIPPTEHFADPVLLDPIRQNVYSLRHAGPSAWSGGGWTVQPFPMTDCPVIITDRSLLDVEPLA